MIIIDLKVFRLNICKRISSIYWLTVVFMIVLSVENINFRRPINKNFIKNRPKKLILLMLLMKQPTRWFKERIFDIKFFQRHRLSNLMLTTIRLALTLEQ